LIAERQRQDAQIKFARMENAVVIEGWIPTDMEAKTVAEVKDASNNACVIESSEPEDSDEVPVQLKNPKFVRSFELLTRLYGLPTYNGVDPTIFIVPGFLLFFSIMLTDAIYGVMAFSWVFLDTRRRQIQHIGQRRRYYRSIIRCRNIYYRWFNRWLARGFRAQAFIFKACSDI